MDEASIANLRADLGEEDGLWPEHVGIVEAFLVCQSQWRVAPMSDGLNARLHYVGLDYAGCRIALEFAGVQVDSELWAGLQIMERAAAAGFNGVKG